MSTTKKTQLKRYNGTDWDILHPETEASQVVDLSSASVNYASSSNYASSANYANSATKASQNANGSPLLAEENLSKKTFQVYRGQSVTDATTGYWAAMCYGGTVQGDWGNPQPNLPTPGWWHVISMDWTDTTTAWTSQLALPTFDQASVPCYRYSNTPTLIHNATWHKFITDENISSQTVAKATTATNVNNLTDNDTGDNANVSFTIGDKTYSKTINNVGHATTSDTATTASSVSWSGVTDKAVATTSVDGLMSSTDKIKLNAIDPSTFVTLATTQNITGQKTFSGSAVFNGDTYLYGGSVLTKTFRPASTETYSIGTSSDYYKAIYVKDYVYPELVNGGNKIQQSFISSASANRLAFLPANQIIIEKSSDAGTTWVDAGISDSTKRAMFIEQDSSAGIFLPSPASCNNMIRMTITGGKFNVPEGTAETDKYSYWNSANIISGERYCSLNFIDFWLSTNGNKLYLKIEAATLASPNTWVTLAESNKANGWPGRSCIRLGNGIDTYAFGGWASATANYFFWRFTFRTMASDGSYDDSKLSNTNAQAIYSLRGYGPSCWVSANNLMRTGHLYTWDSNQTATFPAQVTATSFKKSGGTSSQFLKADGSVDNSTYLTAASLPTIDSALSSTSTNAVQNKVINNALTSIIDLTGGL